MSAARAALRWAVRGRVLKRRLPAEFGAAALFLSPESQLRYLRPGIEAFDPQLLQWASRYIHPGDQVWDIGANCGVFSMAAAGKGASVLAVEPDPFSANILLRTRAANPDLKLEVLAAAVSDSAGLATLEISPGGRAANHLAGFDVRSSYGAAEGRVMVPTVRLDDLLAVSRPDFIKIDVEGAEAAVLRGAARVLAEVKPVMVVEVGKELRPEVFGILEAAGYSLRQPLAPDLPATDATYNILALPG